MDTLEKKLTERDKDKDIELLKPDAASLREEIQHNLVKQPKLGFWAVFSSTFITIFFAEMGDKTQLVTLLMSAESQSPWVVFTGAAIALIFTSLLGVLIGYWLSKKLSPRTLDLSVAILLLVITGWLISDVIS
jgi:putative Ca2+/H+ antiporter (TMEM165/GDT1 family)